MIHTEYTEKWGQSDETVLDGILLYNLLQHVSTPSKIPPSSNLKYTKRDHLIHHINP